MIERCLSIIQKKFVILAILNISDILFTLYLIKTGVCYEANSFMQGIIQNPILSIVVKALIPAMLLYYIYIRMKKASEKQLRIGSLITNVALTVYVLINLSHVVWTVMYLVYC